MELNLQKLFSGKLNAEEGETSLDFAARDFGGFAVETPVWLGYQASGKNGAVELSLSVKAEVQAACARCLAPLRRPWQLARAFRITQANLEEEFPELPFTSAGGLDLAELAYEELLMDVGPVLLCREDCPGLCQHCGGLKGECACTQEPEGDPRLQVLKQLLQAAEEDIKP